MKELMLQITPLGAAVVEAMPDSRKVKRIQKRFETRRECPVSETFSADEVEAFYRKLGKEIKAIQ